MSYSLTMTVDLGPVYAGATLYAQLKDTDGSNVGGQVTAGFVEVGDGVFMWTGTIPAAFRGVVAFYNDADDAFAAMASINPSDAPQARNITFG